jgi:hypothetical protein
VGPEGRLQSSVASLGSGVSCGQRTQPPPGCQDRIGKPTQSTRVGGSGKWVAGVRWRGGSELDRRQQMMAVKDSQEESADSSLGPSPKLGFWRVPAVLGKPVGRPLLYCFSTSTPSPFPQLYIVGPVPPQKKSGPPEPGGGSVQKVSLVLEERILE